MLARLTLALLLLPLPAVAAPDAAQPPAAPAAAMPDGGSGYVARNDSVQQLFGALASKMGTPVILSQRAGKKMVTGRFELDSPWGALERFCDQLGLIWYYDGRTVYVYDAAETKNAVISLRHTELKTLKDFLVQAGLYDKRYPIKGVASSGTFYLSGPPVYVDVVLNAAGYMDQRNSVDLNGERIEVLGLRNTFVSDRSYRLRDRTVTIPGIATVLRGILRDSGQDVAAAVPRQAAATPPVFDPNDRLPGAGPAPAGAAAAGGRGDDTFRPGRISIQDVPENNSLLVRGRSDQIDFIRNLVRQLDVAKRHVELALWIIDISKESLDQLGVQWSGNLRAGAVQVGFNAGQVPISALDGNRFLARIEALSKNGRADVVTRPVVLTQENVPAIFDNSETFFTKLQGERVAQLEHVTYGTMISVLPRIAGDTREIEMVLNIEDGSSDGGGRTQAGDLPTVRRTQISTVARVPVGKSLLVGGYAVNQSAGSEQKVPLLGSIPLVGGLFRHRGSVSDNRLRLFLIEPRVLDNGAGWDSNDFSSAQNPGSAATVLRTIEQLRRYLDRHALD